MCSHGFQTKFIGITAVVRQDALFLVSYYLFYDKFPLNISESWVPAARRDVKGGIGIYMTKTLVNVSDENQVPLMADGIMKR